MLNWFQFQYGIRKSLVIWSLRIWLFKMFNYLTWFDTKNIELKYKLHLDNWIWKIIQQFDLILEKINWILKSLFGATTQMLKYSLIGSMTLNRNHIICCHVPSKEGKHMAVMTTQQKLPVWMSLKKLEKTTWVNLQAACDIKLLIVTIYLTGIKAGVFITFYPSLIFVNKVGAYPMVLHVKGRLFALSVRCWEWNTLKLITFVSKLTRVKRFMVLPP